jgi:predicted 3-demethylubiquinone-9 3-methyltransferase (glyoxalase superfamily)
MTVGFGLEGQEFAALNGGPVFKINEAVSFIIHCDGQVEVGHSWEKLTGGGVEVRCGWLKDRHGVSWQVVPHPLMKAIGDPDLARAKRAMQALLTIKGIDIAKIEAAARGE